MTGGIASRLRARLRLLRPFLDPGAQVRRQVAQLRTLGPRGERSIVNEAAAVASCR